jgi:uncharacterized phage-associated protein
MPKPGYQVRGYNMGEFRTVSALHLSHYILSFIPSSQLKLQKLVYYSEGWHLAYFEHPLIDEDFEAWVHGPAVRSLWNHYKGKGNYFAEWRLNPEYAERIRNYFRQLLQPVQIELIADVLKEYGNKSAYHLESLSHAEAPWREARNGRAQSEHSEAVISKETMKKYYQSILAK